MITGIYHVAYSVTDLDAALVFYRDGLGFPEYFRLNRDDGSLMLIYLDAGGGTYIELFPNAEKRADEPAGNEAGYRHLCLEVDDMDATLAELAARGITPDADPRTGKDGNVQAWITDPDGNRIELMHRVAK